MLNNLRFLLRALFRRNTVETELDDELRSHFEHEVEKYKQSGMTQKEATRHARLSFGGHEQVKQDCRDAHGTSFIADTLQDIRYALRQLTGNPVFAAVIVLTLALSIGANSAIFSVFDSVLLKSLPYQQPERITRIFLTSADYPKFPLNPFDFRDFRTRSKSFDSLAAFTRGDRQLSGASGDPEHLNGFSFVGLECCGKIVLVAVDGGACGTDSLRSMESKHVLEELSAKGAPLMVRNCKGHFLDYQPRTPLVPSYFDRMHINLGLPGE